MSSRLRRRLLFALAVLLVAIVSAAYFAPYVYPELEYRLHGKDPAVRPKPVVTLFPVRGVVTFATGFPWNNR
jgi:hypothetical protein